jgi:hypothetical protein
MLAVALRATNLEREQRYPGIPEFVDHWRNAVNEFGFTQLVKG